MHKNDSQKWVAKMRLENMRSTKMIHKIETFTKIDYKNDSQNETHNNDPQQWFTKLTHIMILKKWDLQKSFTKIMHKNETQKNDRGKMR